MNGGNYTRFPYVRSDSNLSGIGKSSSGSGKSLFEVGSAPNCIYTDDYTRELWADDNTCFVISVPVIPFSTLTDISSTDPAFPDGAYPHVGYIGIWGENPNGTHTLLYSGPINPKAKIGGGFYYAWTSVLPVNINITPYISLVVALDPLYAWTSNIPDTSVQFVSQYDLNPAANFTFNYLGVHAIGTAFTTIPTVKGGTLPVSSKYCLGKWLCLGGVG